MGVYMILKAKFNSSIDNVKKAIASYQQINGTVNFFMKPDAVFSDTKTVVIGEQNEIMFLIGYIAGLGVHTLEDVSKV
jgi:hypothetical protein